jgi:hypothetical protein
MGLFEDGVVVVVLVDVTWRVTGAEVEAVDVVFEGGGEDSPEDDVDDEEADFSGPVGDPLTACDEEEDEGLEPVLCCTKWSRSLPKMVD